MNDTITPARLTRWDHFEDRFWARIEKTSTCWLWLGPLDTKGYGQRVGLNGRSVRPHRLAYELLHGPIPDGLVIDHLCRVRNCVNPDHLDPVTALENTARGTKARWNEPCPNGHPPQFRKQAANGRAFCSECRRAADRRRDERHRPLRRAASRARYHRRSAT